MKKGWVPERQEIIWIDCSPQSGREMRDRHPFLVLSSGAFNDRTSLVIGLPMTTAEYNSDNPFAVAAGAASGRKTGKTSYIRSQDSPMQHKRSPGNDPLTDNLNERRMVTAISEDAIEAARSVLVIGAT